VFCLLVLLLFRCLFCLDCYHNRVVCFFYPPLAVVFLLLMRIGIDSLYPVKCLFLFDASVLCFPTFSNESLFFYYFVLY